MNKIRSSGLLIASIVLACGTSAAMADVVTIASGTASGSGVRVITAANTAGSIQHNYGDGNSWQFATFTNTTFTAAQNGSVTQVLPAGQPGTWNNPGNTPTGWTGTNSAAMDNAGARWINYSANSNPTPVTSALYAIPFAVGNNTLATITLTFVTDNGLGSTNGANNQATPAGYQNGGLFLNGSAAQVSYSPAGTGPNGVNGGNPREFLNSQVQQLTFTNVSLLANQTNWLYIHQFNWGSFGGTAFVANITMVPLPAPVFGGIAGLAGVGGLVAIRRRRMA